MALLLLAVFVAHFSHSALTPVCVFLALVHARVVVAVAQHHRRSLILSLYLSRVCVCGCCSFTS